MNAKVIESPICFRIAFLLCALFVSSIGCVQTIQKNALAVWRSPESSPRQRVDAVSQLIPVGTTGAQVKRTLGIQGTWTHWHGPSASISMENGAITAHPKRDHDYWTLEYRIADGVIALYFEESPGGLQDDYKFLKVGFREHLNVPPIE